MTLHTAEALAQKFHETYERLAPEFGYKTVCAVILGELDRW